MKFTSALFVIILIAQNAFATTTNFAEIIEKSEEGKEVFDNLFLQVSLKGDFNGKVLSEVIKQMKAAVAKCSAERKAAVKQHKTECDSDMKKVKEAFHSLVTKALGVDRKLKTAKNRQRRRTVFLSRSSEELEHYRAFRGWISDNEKAWKKFYQTQSNNASKIQGFLAQVDAHVRNLAKHGAFVQLPGTFTNSLAQIKSEFENNSENIGGLRAVISNIFELVEKSDVMTQADFRHKVRSLIRHISDRLGDIQVEYAEENETQLGLFEALGSLFNDAIARATKVVTHLTKQAKAAEKNISMLTQSVRGAEGLANQAQSIANQRASECRFVHRRHKKSKERSRKIRSALRNLEDAIVDRYEGFKAFFLEKTNS